MTNIESLKKIYSGKVRDLYEIDNANMLMVASDRLSTFDIILPQSIPQKGIFLTQISLYWFEKLKHIINNHLTNLQLDNYLTPKELIYAKNRSIIVKKLKPIPIESIVRGYMAGSGYKDYLKNSQICGFNLPAGLENASILPEVIFTPSTKANVGSHDENITLTQCYNIIGKELTNKIQEISIKLYKEASNIAQNAGIIIADTKFEFGLDENDNLVLMDEILTPDSSRFWDMSLYSVGTNPPSFDKQFVRDYLESTLKWNKKPPIPMLPNDIIEKTVNRYSEIIKRLNIQMG